MREGCEPEAVRPCLFGCSERVGRAWDVGRVQASGGGRVPVLAYSVTPSGLWLFYPRNQRSRPYPRFSAGTHLHPQVRSGSGHVLASKPPQRLEARIRPRCRTQIPVVGSPKQKVQPGVWRLIRRSQVGGHGRLRDSLCKGPSLRRLLRDLDDVVALPRRLSVMASPAADHCSEVGVHL